MRVEARGDAMGVPPAGMGAVEEDPNGRGSASWKDEGRDGGCCRDGPGRSDPCPARCGVLQTDASCCRAEVGARVRRDDDCLPDQCPARVCWGDCCLQGCRDVRLGFRGVYCRTGAFPGFRDACCRSDAYCCCRGCFLRDVAFVRCYVRCCGGFPPDAAGHPVRCGGCRVPNGTVRPSPTGRRKAWRIMWRWRYCVIAVSCLDGFVLYIQTRMSLLYIDACMYGKFT